MGSVIILSFTHQCRITVSYPEILTVETEIARKSRLALVMATHTEVHVQYLGNHPFLKSLLFPPDIISGESSPVFFCLKHCTTVAHSIGNRD